ncbi:ABC transporter family substrate-binding protein [Streptomyces albus subsp. chlorinus]|uniref:ABC transporter family substrate-binding protein n=1 Tax=Streptomyces albus TaxID=1888 RepID=UPI00156DF468|nr:ABC transporter family substrate-binding protein [Streptomyces albus]NSC23687.1 ABC transporter family substrate-binding protein [Streptomyces albus subsp. chlorinus]
MRAVPAESARPPRRQRDESPSRPDTAEPGTREERRARHRRGGRGGRRWVAALVAGVLLPLPLAACGADEDTSDDGAGSGIGAGTADADGDVRATDRRQLSAGGTLRWAVDAAPTTFNVFQPDASEATKRVAAATLPALFTLDQHGTPQLNKDYLDGAEVTSTEPRQTVVYKLNPKARWSDGRRVSAADFRAQWKALRGKDNAFWTARNAGYERIRKITRGEGAGEVKVVFAKPYADWRSLFTPLYPKQAMRSPHAFNDGSRTALPASAGPFRVVPAKGKKTGRDSARDRTVLRRDARWWGERAKLDRIVLRAVPRDERTEALAEGKVDVADVGGAAAKKIGAANGLGGPRRPGAAGERGEKREAQLRRERKREARERLGAATAERLSAYEVRTALDPAYTQLALNGSRGPLADERVRRAVARAIDRGELARKAMEGTGLPAKPLGSHLRMTNQNGYRDNSGAVGGEDVDAAQSLLADAGWKTGGALTRGGPGTRGSAPKGEPGQRDGHRGGARSEGGPAEPPASASSPQAGARAPYREEAEASVVRLTAAQIAQVVDKPLNLTVSTTTQRAAMLAQSAHARMAAAERSGSERALRRARAALRTAERVRATARELRLLEADPATAVRGKEGKPLALRFVLPGGKGSAQLRATGERIARMLDEVGIRTQIKKVPGDSYFKDHIAAGEYDLALYSWPATAFPATEARPIFAKPQPAPDGSLLVEQNYARVGTDQIDQLFEQAAGELDDGRRAELMEKADARIWAVAGSLPLYQRPQLVAAKRNLANVGAFGFRTPAYEDIGYRKG